MIIIILKKVIKIFIAPYPKALRRFTMKVLKYLVLNNKTEL